MFRYSRVETLTGFINALALFFASWNIVWEAFERLWSPQELNSEKLLVVSVLGLLVNIVGIFAFDHGGSLGHHHHHGHDHSHHGHDHHNHGHDHSHHSHDHHNHGHDHHNHDHSHSVSNNHIMHGMFLHVLADALGSVSVIISSLLIQFFGWTWSDPLCSIFIAVLICYTTWPLLISSGEIMLQRSPKEFDSKLSDILFQVCSCNSNH